MPGQKTFIQQIRATKATKNSLVPWAKSCDMATPATIEACRRWTRSIAKIRRPVGEPGSGGREAILGPHEAEGCRDFWIAFATSTSSLSPTNFNKMLWNYGLPRWGRHWRRIVLKRLVLACALSRANLLTTLIQRELCRGRTLGEAGIEKSSPNGIGRGRSF